MRLPSGVFSIAAAIGWFTSQLFAKNPKLKMMLKWLFGITFVVAGLYAVWPSTDETKTLDNHQQIATTTGNNSPAVNASTTGNSSPLNVTVNNGISEAAMFALLKDKTIAANRELSERYPLGYALIGATNGKIIYVPNLKDIKIKTDWDRNTLTLDKTTGEVNLLFEDLEVSMGNGPPSVNYNLGLRFEYVENKPMQMPFGFSLNRTTSVAMFCEVLDANKGVFVIGFR